MAAAVAALLLLARWGASAPPGAPSAPPEPRADAAPPAPAALPRPLPLAAAPAPAAEPEPPSPPPFEPRCDAARAELGERQRADYARCHDHMAAALCWGPPEQWLAGETAPQTATRLRDSLAACGEGGLLDAAVLDCSSWPCLVVAPAAERERWRTCLGGSRWPDAPVGAGEWSAFDVLRADDHVPQDTIPFDEAPDHVARLNRIEDAVWSGTLAELVGERVGQGAGVLTCDAVEAELDAPEADCDAVVRAAGCEPEAVFPVAFVREHRRLSEAFLDELPERCPQAAGLPWELHCERPPCRLMLAAEALAASGLSLGEAHCSLPGTSGRVYYRRRFGGETLFDHHGTQLQFGVDAFDIDPYTLSTASAEAAHFMVTR